MFLNDWLQRKLASVLQPWLTQDSELQLKLGFLRSHGIARDLCFDTHVLTQQLDDSSRFAFTDFRIDELELGVSNWSFPAFRIDVDGLHVTLTLRDIRDENRVNQRQQTADRSADDMKKVLSEIDPEGIALNDAMESLSAIICSNSRKTSILCTVLGHCHLRIRHIHLSVQCLTSNNSYSCMLEMKDFDIESGFTGHRCFVRAVISSLLLPSTENSFKLGVRGLTVGLKDKDNISNIFSSRYLQTSITLKDLRLVNFSLSNPELEFAISPAQIFIIAAMSKLSTSESKCARNGRQLWSIAASRYNSLLPARKWSFQKLVNVICLWLRYVHAYEHLLSSVGYPVDKMMKKSVLMMSHDKQYSILVKQKWNEISAIEKDLPLEAAVLARRLVRCRVASSVNQSKDISVESIDNNRHTSFILKILNLLAIFWSYICSTYYSIILRAFQQSHYLDHLNDNSQGIASKNACLQHCYSVNIGIISITIYPEKAVERSVSRRAKSDIGISYSNLLSFCFTVDTFYFLYEEKFFDRFLSFSCGNLEATSSSVMMDSLNNHDSYLKGRKKKSSDPVLALWGQPAQVFDYAEANSFAFVGCQVKEMWSTWRNSCAELKDGNTAEHPFILCEIKNFLTDQGFGDKSSGFKNCCLVIGELNLILDYASIVSTVLILKQIQSALYQNDCSLETNVPLDSPMICEDPLPRSWDSKYYSCASEMEFELYKLLPHQHIQAAVFIAGPQIRISLNKEELFVDEAHVNSMHDDICLVFNIRSIELGVKPNLASDLESSFWGQDELPSCPRLKEPELTYSSLSAERICKCQARSALAANLKVNGLIVYFDTKNQQDEVIVLNPTTIRLSSIRKELHSFGATVVAFSAGLHWITTELAVLIFMDEFSILVKVVDGLTSILTNTITVFDPNGYMNLDGSGREEIVQGHSGNTGTLVSRVNWGNLIESSTGFVINCTFEIKAIDIVLHKSRESNYKDTSDTLGNKRLTMHEVLDYGICISIKESHIGISYVARDADILASLSVLRAGIFNFVSDVIGNYDQFSVSNLLLHSMNFKKELSFSDCTFSLWLRCLAGDSCKRVQSFNDASDCDGEILNLTEEFPMATDNEGSITLSPNISHKFSVTGQNIGPASSHRMLINISLGEIYFAGSTIKDLLFGEHNLNKLKLSFSIGENCRKISCLTQGGSIFLEAEAVAMFFQCLTSYEQGLRQVLPAAPLPKENLRAGTVRDVTVHNNHHSQGLETTHQNVNQDKLDKLDKLVIGLSEISLVLVARDELGILQEILFELDVYLDVEMAERRKFLLRLSQFSIISHILYESIEQQSSEIHISQSSSDMSNHPSSLAVTENTTKATAEDPTIPISGDPTTAFQQMRGIHSALDEASSSGRSIAPIESYTDTTRPKVSGLSPQNCILKHSSASLALEKFMPRDISSQQYWVGGGSISGFEITISLQEIQIILSTMETMSGSLSQKRTNNVEQKYLTRNQESERNFEDVVPDGTVVALQDVHHHTYITIEGGPNNYNVVGSIHYSVVGDRALFRVKYHYQRRWGSTVLWISLTSLYARSDSGEPLRLNCRAGSSFVDISSSSDSAWALWKINPFNAVNYYGDTEVDSYCPVATNMFHLINRKNDRGIAFADDSFECVSKPGNPFKLKVLQDHTLAHDIYMLDTYPVEALETGIKEGSEGTESQTCIIIEVDKCIVTIVHEISTTKEKIPLLQLSIVCQELLMQILHIKARIMSKLNVVLYYFDAQRNLWSELLHPAEISIFCRYRFQIAGIETSTVPVHFYAKIKQLDISMTELSLDILLFVIGELNLAGPFAVKSSVILANCCKVENQSGLTLLCHFDQNQYASVARNQSSMVFLRHLASVGQTSDAPIVSVQLTDQGSFTTSPVHISLLEAKTFAWRTRIVSSQEPKTYPGPFIVAEVSRRRGDGLSLAVSPLLRIHNETDFSMELRFQRPEHKESESASVILKSGDTIDDTLAAFSAINLSGGSKKALVSLSVGNYLFSFRPEIAKDLRSLSKLKLVEWSNDLKGGKAIYLSGLFDKLSYRVRKALSTESLKCSFSIAHCSLNFEEGHMGDIDFLIQSIGRDIPVIQPDSTGYTSGNKNSHVALQEQKEIFILPTIQISNLLQSEVEVFLSDKDSQNIITRDKIGKFAIVPCGSTSNLYANPATIYFTFTLTAYKSSCKQVNCADWVKKLQKQKSDVNSLDIELDFGSGKYFAFLRLAFKDNGILEAAIFTPYTLKNETEFLLFCCGPNQKPLSRYEAGKLDSEIPPELGSFLPAKSTSSWFIKCNKVRLILLDRNESHTVLDLDALSGLTEIDLEVEGSGCKFITKLGVSLKPSAGNIIVPSRTVSINPRYIVSNESEETIDVRQCYLEDEMQGIVAVNGKQRTAVHLRNVTGSKKEMGVFDKFLRHHKSARDDSLLYVQFKPKDVGFDWSGPVCVTSLGRFFLKFKRFKDYHAQDINNHAATLDNEYSSVHVIEEDSTLVLHFYRPPHTSLPYRIENCLEDAPITYYQKDSSEPEVIRAGGTTDYVWDDSNLPHKLVIQISEVQLLREINLDKLRAWKPFYRAGKQRGLGLQLPLHRNPGNKESGFGHLNGTEIITSGFEVYADGPTRVLRICEFPDSHKANTSLYSGAKMQLRVFNSAISILESSKKERDTNEVPAYTPIIVIRLVNIYMDSLLTNHRKCNSIRVQSLSVDEKWIGAPFASMIRRHHSQYADTDSSMLHVVFILLSTSSEVKHVEYSSIVLQPFDLNIDEETLMRIVPFLRTSLSDSHTESQQYYFDHFEIHPIKIIASFLPGEFYSSYSSTQETLRSLLHSVIKIPAIKQKSVELNGVLVTHAMITIRELSIKCAQHYSWYAMRAIYIAKGSPLLPPAFASIFDDSASSSLDVFFDPSSGLINLPGLTIGTFKLISKSIDSKGFSGTKRYFGDLGKTLKAAGSNVLFAAATEISDSILKGAETSGFNGMVSGFHQGVLKLAMEPTLLGTAFIEGGPDRKIKLDRNPGVDELYIEGYLQAMLDAMYKQEYLRVRVIDDQVILKNLPPSSSLIEEIMDRVKGFLVSKTLLKGDSSSYRPLRHIRGETDWKIGPTILTLCEHLFVSFMIRGLRKQAGKVTTKIKLKEKLEVIDGKPIVAASVGQEEHKGKGKFMWRLGIGRFVLSGMIAYLDGRLCRCIPNPIARRIVSGFLLTLLDQNDQ